MVQLEKKNSLLLRWGLLIYSILALTVTGVYIGVRHEFLKVDWMRYDRDGDYRRMVDGVLKHGVFWIRGNIHEVRSPLLIGLLALGCLVSVLVFVLAWRSFVGRTLAPVLSFIGFLAPLLVRYAGNVFWLLFVGYIFVILGAWFSVLAMRNLSKK